MSLHDDARGRPPRSATFADDQRVFAGALSGTGLLLLGFGLASGLNLIFQVALARRLPVGDVGRYFEATALVGIAMGLCVGGLRAALVRYVATLNADEGATLAARIVRWDVGAATAVAALAWALAPAIATTLFHDRGAAGALRVVAVGLPFGVTGTLWAAAARGRRAFAAHLFAEQLAQPAVRLGVALTGFALGFGLTAATWGYAAGMAGAAVAGLAAAWRLGFLRRRPQPLPAGRLGEALRFSGYRWGIDLLQVILLWADTVILGAFYPPRVAGVYSVATRVVVFLTAGLAALNLVVAPYAARAWHHGDRAALSRAYALASRWAILLTFPPLAVALALRPQVLRLFGPQFAGGGTPLAILALGFAFNAACGPCGVVLNMSALNRLVLADNVAAVVANVGLNLVLVSRWGMTGAAIAWSVALVLVNLLMLAQVRRHLRMEVPTRSQVVSAIAFGLALAASFVAGRVGPAWGVGMAVVGTMVAGVMTRVPEEMAAVRAFLRVAIRGNGGNGAPAG